MNQNDGRDREVRDYVRNRMAADMPPEFTRDVMNDVHRTTQRRRGFAWPIFTGLATVAAAVAVVVIGLGLINPREPVGSEPTPSASASPEASESSTPMPSASESATTPSPTAEPSTEPTAGEGEFGPIHSMTPEEAFENGQSCEVTNAIVNAEPTDLTWHISFPTGWSTNEESTDFRSACTLFGPEPFEAPDDQAIPDTVAVVTDISPGGDFGPGGTFTTMEYTVDGVAAVRYEIEPEEGGFVTEPAVVWIIAIAGNLPAEGNDQPYLAISTSSADDEQLTERAEVLDRMVATLDIGE